MSVTVWNNPEDWLTMRMKPIPITDLPLAQDEEGYIFHNTMALAIKLLNHFIPGEHDSTLDQPVFCKPTKTASICLHCNIEYGFPKCPEVVHWWNSILRVYFYKTEETRFKHGLCVVNTDGDLTSMVIPIEAAPLICFTSSHKMFQHIGPELFALDTINAAKVYLKMKYHRET